MLDDQKIILGIYLADWKIRSDRIIETVENLGVCTEELAAFKDRSADYAKVLAKAAREALSPAELAYVKHPDALIEATSNLHLWDKISESPIKDPTELNILKHAFDGALNGFPEALQMAGLVAEGNQRAMEIVSRSWADTIMAYKKEAAGSSQAAGF